MILVDTSFFVAMLDRRDALHARARAWAARLVEPLITTEYILWETANFASATAHRVRVRDLVSEVLDSAMFEVIDASRALTLAGLELYGRRSDQSWSLTDCVSFVVMRERGLRRALTHDHHFQQAGFEALLRRDPFAGL